MSIKDFGKTVVEGHRRANEIIDGNPTLHTLDTVSHVINPIGSVIMDTEGRMLVKSAELLANEKGSSWADRAKSSRPQGPRQPGE